jgi:hypothetical protein
MSYMKDLIEQAAEMLSMGYSDHEVIRILGVPAKDAGGLIEAAERWNDDTWVPMTDEIIDEMAAYYGED